MRSVLAISLLILASLWLSACSSDPQTPQSGEPSESERSALSIETINTDSFYPEGPLWLDGRLFYTEYSEDRIMTYDGGRNRVFWKQEGCGASGLVQTQDHTLLVTCYDSNTLAEVSPEGETVGTIKTDSAEEPFVGPNDFTEDSKGGIYLSASGVYSPDAPAQGKVHYIAPDGEIREVARGIHYSNGLGLTPDGRLLVAEMLEKRVLSYAVRDDGGLEDRQVFAKTEELAPTPSGAGPLDGPDGLKVADNGNVYITQNGAGRVLVTDPDAGLLRKVEVPADHVTNVAFGPTPRTLYITSAMDASNEPYPGEVYRAELR